MLFNSHMVSDITMLIVSLMWVRLVRISDDRGESYSLNLPPKILTSFKITVE